VTINVDTLALGRNGAELAASPAPVDPIPVPPAGTDPISMMVTALTNGQTANLGAASADGSARREVGGTALIGSAAVHESADTAGADLFKNLGSSADGAASGLRDLVVPPALQLPTTPPPVAAMLLPPEAFSQALHSGDASPWRAAAEQLLAAGQGHRVVADSTAAAATGIDESWQDGVQQAGANTALNARLTNDLADGYIDTATALQTFAQHRDNAVRNTPTPEEYARARANLAQAQESGNPVLVAIAARELAELNVRSTEAQLGYQSDVNDTAAQHDKPPATSNNIADGRTGIDGTHIGNDGDAIDKAASLAAQHAAIPGEAPALIGPGGSSQRELNAIAERAAGSAEALSSFGKGLGMIGTGLDVINGGIEFNDELNQGGSVGTALIDVVPKTAGTIGGGMAGAASGAELGAFAGAAGCSFVPVVGTVTCGVVGAGVGAFLGGWGGGEAGSQLGEDFSKTWHAVFG
jgi:hypothetical protein